MKPKRLVVLAGVVLFALCLFDAFGWDSEYRKSFALSSFAEIAEIIVVGRVVQKDFVQRVVRPNLGEHTTTDITVEGGETRCPAYSFCCTLS